MSIRPALRWFLFRLFARNPNAALRELLLPLLGWLLATFT